MKKVAHTETSTNHGDPSALSQVSFPTAFKRVSISDEGARLSRERLHTLMKSKDVHFELSPEQLEHYLAAKGFLEGRYAKLGMVLPATGPAFVYDRYFSTTGICDSLLRSPGVRYSPKDPHPPEYHVASWVHELTHASGNVRWGAARSMQPDQNWQFTISRAGWLVRLGRQNALFAALEEYAATSNECTYLAQVEGVRFATSQEVRELSLHAKPAVGVRIFKLCKQLYEPEVYAEIEKSPHPRRWERAYLEAGEHASVSVSRMCWSKDGGDSQMYVYDLFPLLNEFAQELYPDKSAADAALSLQELILTGQVSGCLSPTLREIKNALGGEAVHFLAEWGPEKGDIITERDIALFSLFVGARKLGADAAREYRADLLSVLRDRRKEDASQRPESLLIEELLLDGEKGRWTSWMKEWNLDFVRNHHELTKAAKKSFADAFDAGELIEAAIIFRAGALSAEDTPPVPFTEVKAMASQLLRDGEMVKYEAVVAAFSPHKRVMPKAQESELIYAAAVEKLRTKKYDLLTEIVKSPICDKDSLNTREFLELAITVMGSLPTPYSKCTLLAALPPVVVDQIPNHLMP